MEIVISLSLVVVVMVLVGQAGYFAMLERGRIDTRQAALEVADNILEAARARPWDGLTPEWAGAQKLPEEWLRQQPDGKLQVRVEPEASGPLTKRVTVEIRWESRPGLPPQELRLVTLLSAREARRQAASGNPR
jgi:hypothetical protein